MRQMTLELDQTYQRPVVTLDNFFGLDAMIDTGAVYPVWMNGEESLCKLGAVKKRNSVPFGGLGGMTNGAVRDSGFEVGRPHLSQYEHHRPPLQFSCAAALARHHV